MEGKERKRQGRRDASRGGMLDDFFVVPRREENEWWREEGEREKGDDISDKAEVGREKMTRGNALWPLY
jgi:hypothetical protein